VRGGGGKNIRWAKRGLIKLHLHKQQPASCGWTGEEERGGKSKRCAKNRWVGFITLGNSLLVP